jgi:hypothetical protein
MTGLRSMRNFLSLMPAAVLLMPGTVWAQESASAIYQQLRAFELTGGSAPANGVVLKRDRGEMTFTSGTFYFSPPVAGKVRGAVFLGEGRFRAEVPPGEFELENVRRMLKADLVESDFKTAVLRFTDDTFEVIGAGAAPGSAPADATKLAQEFEKRVLKETGANIAARLTLSIVNRESPGFFLAEFDKGQRKRFTLLLDAQGRIPSATFSINGGEKGMVYSYRDTVGGGNDVWMAFYSEGDYARRSVDYSDAFDLIDTLNYDMEVDLRDPGRRMGVRATLRIKALADGLRAIPFALGEDLPEYDSMRLKKNMKLKSAAMADGSALEAVQEEWEGGLTVFLPAARKAGEEFSIVITAEGDFLAESGDSPRIAGGRIVWVSGCYYPWINGQWYPRHGYLRRSAFEIAYQHKKRLRVAGNGVRVYEGAAEDDKDSLVTKWKMEDPVALITFALGPFERHEEVVKDRGLNIPVEFHSLSGGTIAIKEDFIVAEMMNAVNYFSAIFGKYPYPRLSGVFHPFGFGQGFPTLLLIPNTDRASKYTFSFIAHETAHQWWGNIVAWRSYRDQWLSEGFAEYSGILYTGLRDRSASANDLIDRMRRDLRDPPVTLTGVGRGKLADVGPIILGHRLSTRETLGAYQALIYSKGGLVLRMLHFLFTDPATGKGDAFFEMMSDFVKQHQGSFATTEGFVQVANQHFVKTAIAQKYGLKDLNWFFRQWVYQAHLPSYRLEYQTEAQPDGSVVVQGVVYQENVPEEWFMPLPLVFTFDKNQVATGTVHAYGPQTSFNIKLPMRPRKVELDPSLWVISEKTTTRGK